MAYMRVDRFACPPSVRTPEAQPGCAHDYVQAVRGLARRVGGSLDYVRSGHWVRVDRLGSGLAHKGESWSAVVRKRTS